MSPLRTRLRAETRAEHEALDRQYGALDLSDPADYALFLRAHHAAHSVVEPLIRPAPPRLAALQRDLAAMGLAEGPAFVADYVNNANLLGLSYVVAGSHLGGKVLKKAWSATKNSQMRDAGGHFEVPGQKRHWQFVLRRLSNVQTGDEPGVIDGARAGFRCFADALAFIRAHP